MRWYLATVFLMGCASFESHAATVRFRDATAVRVSTRAPDGTVAELPTGAQVHDVAAGGGMFREEGADTRASYTVRAARERDGASVLDWNTGMALVTGDEVEVVHGDGRLADVHAGPTMFITPRADDLNQFYAHLCVAPERRSSRGSLSGYALATHPNAGPDTGCPRGVAVDVRTPWTNVLEVRDHVGSAGPFVGAMLLLNGLPFLIAGAVLSSDESARDVGIPFVILGAVIAGLAIPAFAHPPHEDLLYPPG